MSERAIRSGVLGGKKNLCEVAGKSGARQHLIRARASRCCDQVGVLVGGKTENLRAADGVLALEGRDRPDGIVLTAVEVEDDQRRLQCPGLLQDLLRRAGKGQIDAGLFCGGTDFRAEKEIVDRDKDHRAIISTGSGSSW